MLSSLGLLNLNDPVLFAHAGKKDFSGNEKEPDYLPEKRRNQYRKK